MHEFLDIVRSPGHWAFEVLSDAIFAGLGMVWVRIHDRRHHR